MAKIRPANPQSSHSPTGSTQGSCGLGTEGRGCRSSWDTAWGQRDLPSTKSQAGPQQTVVTLKAQHTRSSATSEPLSPTPLWGLLSQSTPSRRQVSLSCVAQSHAPCWPQGPSVPHDAWSDAPSPISRGHKGTQRPQPRGGPWGPLSELPALGQPPTSAPPPAAWCQVSESLDSVQPNEQHQVRPTPERRKLSSDHAPAPPGAQPDPQEQRKEEPGGWGGRI